MILIVCCIGFFAFAGDTNFVAAFQAMWQTHNATNILVFTEQNVATNKSPETLFARGCIAIDLQGWGAGATNYWEEAAQMIDTNGTYSAVGKTNIIKTIRWLQEGITDPSDPLLPSWNTNDHIGVFALSPDNPMFYKVLQAISTIPPAKE